MSMMDDGLITRSKNFMMWRRNSTIGYVNNGQLQFTDNAELQNPNNAEGNLQVPGVANKEYVVFKRVNGKLRPCFQHLQPRAARPSQKGGTKKLFGWQKGVHKKVSPPFPHHAHQMCGEYALA